MTAVLINKAQLSFVAKKRLQYHLHIAEKDYSSHHTVKIEKLQYIGVLDQPSYLKIDISNVKNQALPTKKLKYENVWDIDVRPNVMDIVEICAEKISATNNRARYRDFYDLFLITQELGVKILTAVKL